MDRFRMAMGAYVVLAILAWTNLTAPIPHSEFEVRHLVLVILGALAVSTWLHRRDRAVNDSEDKEDLGSDSNQ